MAAEGLAASVVAHGGAGISVAGRFLDIAQWDAGVERGGDERMTQRVRSNAFVEPGSTGEATNNSPRRMPIETIAVIVDQDRPVETFADGQGDSPRDAWCEGHGGQLAALAHHGEGPAPALHAERADVGAECFRDPQTVQCQQRDQA